MTKPRSFSTHQWTHDLTPEQRAANRAEWLAWDASPEGIAEQAAKVAAEAAKKEAEAERYAALLPVYVRFVLEQAGVPGRALDVLATETQDTAAMRAVAGAEDLLVLLGAPGVGKTCAAASWLRSYVADPSRWAPTDWDMLTTPAGSLYASMARGGPVPGYLGRGRPVWLSAAQLARVDHYDQAEIDRIAKAPRLVVDDLFSEFKDSKGFFASLLDEIVDARYSAKLPMVITSNLDLDGFKGRYDSRIVDRIREAGRFFGCGSESLRRRTTTTPSTTTTTTTTPAPKYAPTAPGRTPIAEEQGEGAQ